MSLSVQFLSLLAMIGTGIVAAAFLDMIGTGTAHAGRRSIIRRRAAFFEVIGWVVVGCWTFYILFLVRDGAWRIYDPFAQLSGMLLYVSFFHKPFRFFGRIVLVILRKATLVYCTSDCVNHPTNYSLFCKDNCTSFSDLLLKYSVNISETPLIKEGNEV